ncbi:MAG TPA: phosphate ABC transporter permease PstA [Nitrososphaera sp.]
MSKRQDHMKIIQDSVERTAARRKLMNMIFTYATIGCVALAMIPLGSILVEVVKNGAGVMSIEFLTQPPGSFVPREGESDEERRERLGGIGPAIQGTIIVVGLASLIGVPVGVLTGIYLSEYAGESKYARSIRFFNNVMTGLPSIVIGVVGFVVLVLTIGSFSAVAGAVVLSIIMIPIVVGVTEETLKLVPNSVREAGHSLGIPKWKVTIFITLMAAKSGVLTGIVLAMSRIAGETAPLIMTILGTSLFFQDFTSPVAALPLMIFRYASIPFPDAQGFAWGAALILILMVLSLSMALRFVVLKRMRGAAPGLKL